LRDREFETKENDVKQTMLTTFAALLLGTAGAQAQDKLTLQLKWVVQAQFAGYLVAKDKGFYKEVGLDVTIKPRRRSSPAAAPMSSSSGCRPRSPRARRAWRWSISRSRSSARA